MKTLSIIFVTAIAFASCKSKDTSLQTDKNIVILTDTSKAAGSYLTDTGLAKMPVAAAPVYVAPAATKRTTTTKKRSSSTYGNSSASNNNSTSNNTGSSTTTSQTTKKKGWSKTAKGAVIGGVGGAVVGGVIGKGAKGAIIGGVLGAAGGAIIGRSKDRKDGRIP